MESVSLNLREGNSASVRTTPFERLVGDSFRERLMSYFQRACQGDLFQNVWSWEGEMTWLSSLCLFPIGTSKNYYN